MAEITNYTSVSISELMANLDRVKYNPSGICRTIFDYMDEVTNGTVDIVDPTNPFVMLLESAAVGTALAVNENLVNLRKQYPSLAQTESELYMHMSDKDFLDRFATPSQTTFTFMIQVQDLLGKMVYDATENCYKATIARDTVFTVDTVSFTMQYPISIRKFDNGVVQVSYDSDITSPLEILTSNIIDYQVRNDAESVAWMFFDIRVKQIATDSVTFPLQKSIAFSQDIPFTDQYYYLRAFYRNNNTLNRWVEIKTTHTDQVYDPFDPTVVLQVFSNYVNVKVPQIYLTNNMLSGEIRFDISTTRGNLNINLANYKLEAFTTQIRALDEERDITPYTNVFSDLAFRGYSAGLINGGTNAIDFSRLRERVIFNSLGDQQLPITNVQIEAYVENRGFDLTKNVDAITNRIFLANRKLPDPQNSRLITPANIGIATFISNLDYLKTLTTVQDNGDRVTIKSNNLFLNTNGILRIIPEQELLSILALDKNLLVDHVNNNSYLYTPFYYVLDNSENEFQLRAYNLDFPDAENLSFIRQNQTLQLPVSTNAYQIEKIAEGYKLTLSLKSGNFYKQALDADVGVQIAFVPSNEIDLVYINGTQIGLTSEGERIFEFIIETNLDLNADNQICITNAKLNNLDNIEVWTELPTDLTIIHWTSSLTPNFVPDETDSRLGKFMLPANASGNTEEALQITFGTALSRLWTRTRSLATGFEYETWSTDVPMLYTEKVYETDPATGSIIQFDGNGDVQFVLLHDVGDPVLDNLGNPVYAHRAGDVKLDANGQPIVITDMGIDKEFDMFFIDGKYYFADDLAFQEYKAEIIATVEAWIVEDIAQIQEILLEQTRIYFYPNTTLGEVKVSIHDNGVDYLPAEQSITVELYVKRAVFTDNEVRQQLINNTISILDDGISQITVNVSDLAETLRTAYGDSVEALRISGIGGTKNYQVVNLFAEHNRLTLKKILEVQQDNTLIIKEDVTIAFHRVD